MMSTNAQLVCYDFSQQTKGTECTDTDVQQMHFGTTNGTFTYKTLKKCTLIYRKALDLAVYKSHSVNAHVTPEGLLVPETTGRVAFSSTMGGSDETDKTLYYFDGATEMHVPIIEHTHNGITSHCINYTPNQTISNLFTNGGREVTTRDLYAAPQGMKGVGNFAALSKCAIGMQLPVMNVNQNTVCVAPLQKMEQMKLTQDVETKSTLTADGVAAALTRHSVHNIIGIAMQRIATSHQGDIMLHDGI